MSSKKSAVPLILDLKPSKILLWLNIAFHAGALIALLISSVPVSWQLIATALICVNCYFVSRQHCLLSNNSSIARIIWDADDNWDLIRRDGRSEQGMLLGDSTVYSWFAVINFFTGSRWRHRSVLITSDRLNHEQFRKLRVRLNISNPQTESNTHTDI